MTDYVKSTNFTSKDSLATGNPLKIVKGAEFDTEFNAIATAVATKADLANPTLTGTPAAPTAATGTNSTQVATTAFVKNAVDAYDAALTVSTAQIEDSAVTNAKIADATIASAKLVNSGVTADTYGSATAIPVLAVNAKGQVTSVTTVVPTLKEIGVSQTWQDVTSSRSASTNYTNSTGKPIMVNVSCPLSGTAGTITLFVDSVEIAMYNNANTSGQGTVSGIVPPSSVYYVTVTAGAIRKWVELR